MTMPFVRLPLRRCDEADDGRGYQDLERADMVVDGAILGAICPRRPVRDQSAPTHLRDLLTVRWKGSRRHRG
jgi:hypothetical protein